jgi:hypothetical protein
MRQMWIKLKQHWPWQSVSSKRGWGYLSPHHPLPRQPKGMHWVRRLEMGWSWDSLWGPQIHYLGEEWR